MGRYSKNFCIKENKILFVANASPDSFATCIQEARDYCDNHPDQERPITIFSWNEWIECGHLLPDTKYGFEYLEKFKEVIQDSLNPYPNSRYIK